MPVTIKVANHAARLYHVRGSGAQSAKDILHGACHDQSRSCKRILQSSFTDAQFAGSFISPNSNGFVHAAYSAYCGHQHLTLRPEDVWFSVLSQLSFYVNAHAEELRSFFVAHEGTETLTAVRMDFSRPVDFGELALQMTDHIAKKVVDPELRTFIIPSFSTTTNTDRAVAAVLMMGALQKYFSYQMHTMCGIPTVTLLGERSDWEDMLQRLEKLPQLGAEPAQFALLLKSVLRYFVATFDDPTSEAVIDFWNKIAHRTGGSGINYLSGWITAFCFWDETGNNKFNAVNNGNGPELPVSHEEYRSSGNAGCELDGVLFHRVDTDAIPCGFTTVPVLVDDTIKTTMIAGSLGISATSTGQLLDHFRDHADTLQWERSEDNRSMVRGVYHYDPQPPTEEPGLDSLQPVSGWMILEKDGQKEQEDWQQSEAIRAASEARDLKWKARRLEKTSGNVGGRVGA